MRMTVLDRGDDITYVVLSGRLDTTGAEEIGDRFSDATAALERPAIVDLSEIEFMASRGIGLLLTNGKKLIKAGHKLVLLNPQKLVESVLKTCKLDMILPVSHDLDEAIQILRGVSDHSVAASPRFTTSEDEPRQQRSESASTVHSSNEGELKLAIKNESSELVGLNAAVRQFLDVHSVPDRAAYAVNLAIDELVVNVMRYAYVADNSHFIDIALAIEGDQIILRIVDDGRPFDPRRGPALDLHAEDREVGGLGLLLVLDMVHRLNYRRVGEKNWVEARIRLVAEDEDCNLSATKGGLPKVGTD
ncbi:MAG: anti-sigma factor antagonist [Thermoguttaceae bacterium]